MSVIETVDLIKQYNGVTVLDLPDLKIDQGERFGLVGNNGAGKTTFFSLILDLIEATEGQVLSKARPVSRSDHWKSYTNAYLDERFVIDFLTPEEYFEFVAGLHRLEKTEYDFFTDRFADFFNDEILGKGKYIRDLSRGNQKKVGIAAAFMSSPEILIMDEPFPNIDPTSVIRLKKLLKNTEATILISSHDLNHVTEVCDRIVILEKGIARHDLQTEKNTLEELERYFTAE